MKRQKIGVNWVIIFIVLILIANLVATVLLYNSYLYQRDLIKGIENKADNSASKDDINSLYLDYYRELSAKTDEAINRILTIVAIIAGAVTIFSVLLAFKAPKDIDRRIDEIKNEIYTAKQAAEEAKYQVQITNALAEKSIPNLVVDMELNDVIDRYPNKPDAYLYRGHQYVERGQYEDAIKDYGMAKKYGIELCKYFNAMGIVFNRSGNYPRSIEYYTNAIKERPIPSYYNNRSTVYRKNKEMDKAIADCNEALSLDPECISACLNLWRVYSDLAKGETIPQKKIEYEDKAKQYYEKAASIDPNNKRVLTVRNYYNKRKSD